MPLLLMSFPSLGRMEVIAEVVVMANEDEVIHDQPRRQRSRRPSRLVRVHKLLLLVFLPSLLHLHLPPQASSVHVNVISRTTRIGLPHVPLLCLLRDFAPWPLYFLILTRIMLTLRLLLLLDRMHIPLIPERLLAV